MSSQPLKLACFLSLALFSLTISLWVWGSQYGRNLLSVGQSPRYSLAFDHHAVVFTRDRVVSESEANAEVTWLHHILRPADPRYATMPDTPATSLRSDYVLGGRAERVRSYGPVYIAAGRQKIYHESPNSHWFAYSRPFGPWWQVSVAYWFLLIVFAMLPLREAFRITRRCMRQRHGQCIACGYSLVANTTGICPECGMQAANCGQRRIPGHSVYMGRQPGLREA